MLVFNTTFQVGAGDAHNFLVYLHEVFVPAAENGGEVRNPRLARVLSHGDGTTECFALQFETDDSASLHRWYSRIGNGLQNDLAKAFKDKVVSFHTLMEVID